MKELPKAYEPQNYEDAIYKRWEESGFFNPDVCVEKGITDKDAEAFSIVLPPPNVTGTLHMGHAAMLAIQDVMARYHRMKGEKTLWSPGTDHAAVATESKVEKMLIESGEYSKPKEELGREKFLERVNQFAQESHDTIVKQSKKMGSSLDWSREAFTLDEKRNLAVKTVFKKMYDDGLIYRGYRVINWSVQGQSTCSDDELVYVERPAKLYTFKYGKDVPITIATTRPETKLGDTAIAVNPEGKWKKYIGQEFIVENFGQTGHNITVKVIADEHVDESFGTGALGVTPAHSQIDFEMYMRQKAAGNDIGLIQVIGEDGKMTAGAGSEYEGLSVEEARSKVVAWLKSEGLMEHEEDIMQNVSTSDRFKDVVEPLPKTQWFVDVNKKFTVRASEFVGNVALDEIEEGKEYSLKEIMQTVVRSGQIKIVPERFDKTYFHWIDNLRDWNISRQIWYGHQIPVWYKGEETYVGVEAPEGDGWTQDPDTLDTWFSSGLWTFSTLGWPENTADFQTFHPTSVLETGYDIIFFWVARMILMTTYTLGQVPFETVYLHGLVRDEQGRKMSKSLGNIINPLDMIGNYGTDATRLSLVVGSAPGNDMKLSEEKIAGFRNFANKLWNISRFAQLTINNEQGTLSKKIERPNGETLADKWILGKLDIVINDVTEHVEKYRFSAAAEILRDFTWNEFADWYLEIVKIELALAKDIGQKDTKVKILNYVLNTILKMWHPYMPFVTEAIWNEFYGADEKDMLFVQKWPHAVVSQNLDVIVNFFDIHRNIVTNVRKIRSEKNISWDKTIDLYIDYPQQENYQKYLGGESLKMVALMKLHSISFNVLEKPDNLISFVIGDVVVSIDLAGAIDVDAEKARLQKEIDHVAPYVTQLEKKLSNSSFVDNAPEAVIAGEKQKLEEAQQKLTALQEQLSSL